MPMVFEEFNKIAEKNKIDQFRSMVRIQTYLELNQKYTFLWVTYPG